MKPSRVFGIDFSGAAKAGRKIWIASGVIDGETLRFESCQRAAQLPNSGRDLERALGALVAFITQQGPCIVGFDFPFGLPCDLVEEFRWDDFAVTFGKRYPEASAFQATCTQKAIALTGHKELRRATDYDAETPLSPYNLRIFRQTFYGIRDVLAPLVRSGAVSVLPMQPAVSGRIWLLEICPASTLKHMGLRQPYKHLELSSVRESILTELIQGTGIVVPECVRDEVTADKEGDALDSVIAAVATFHALRDSIDCEDQGVPSQVEGFVYM
jgi:hypothetical protein